MKTIGIYCSASKHALYEGLFCSYRACLESAVRNNINLEGADLRYKNLSNAALDGARIKGADFSGANLTGANISEACLSQSLFNGASFYNTCLADSDLAHCDFEDASFGATQIMGSDISYSSFSTLSCFTLDFDLVSAMQSCVFKNPNGTLSLMSRPPLVIKGHGAQPIVLLDDHMKIGALTLPYLQRYSREDSAVNG
ncbi:MAG: pentapeptide repeat-containing protein [Alphaproteobacteria bacterium]